MVSIEFPRISIRGFIEAQPQGRRIPSDTEFPRISIRGFIEASSACSPARRARAYFREFLFAALLKHRGRLGHRERLPHFREFLFAALLKLFLPFFGVQVFV